MTNVGLLTFKPGATRSLAISLLLVTIRMEASLRRRLQCLSRSPPGVIVVMRSTEHSAHKTTQHNHNTHTHIILENYSECSTTMIVQSTKATQADFARDFLTLTNDFQDESDWTMSEDDEDDFQNADGYYHQSWKSLPPTTIDAGRAHSSDEHALQYRPVSVKSLPLNNDAALAQEDGESSTHFKLSRKKLSNAHLQVSSGVEKRIVSADVIEGSLDDIEHTNQPTENENALSSGTQELPLFKRKHAPMSAEEQTRQAAFLRAKLADFEAADPKPTTSVQNDGRRSLEKGLKRGRKRKAAKVEEVIAEESSQSVLEKCVKNSESETSRTYEEEISKEEESTAVGDKSKKMHSKGKKTKTCDDQTHPDFHASESEMFWLGPLIYPTWPLQRVHGTRKMARLRKAKNAKRVNREVKEVPQKVKNLVVCATLFQLWRHS